MAHEASAGATQLFPPAGFQQFLKVIATSCIQLTSNLNGMIFSPLTNSEHPICIQLTSNLYPTYVYFHWFSIICPWFRVGFPDISTYFRFLQLVLHGPLLQPLRPSTSTPQVLVGPTPVAAPAQVLERPACLRGGFRGGLCPFVQRDALQTFWGR